MGSCCSQSQRESKKEGFMRKKQKHSIGMCICEDIGKWAIIIDGTRRVSMVKPDLCLVVIRDELIVCGTTQFMTGETLVKTINSFSASYDRANKEEVDDHDVGWACAVAEHLTGVTRDAYVLSKGV